MPTLSDVNVFGFPRRMETKIAKRIFPVKTWERGRFHGRDPAMSIDLEGLKMAQV